MDKSAADFTSIKVWRHWLAECSIAGAGFAACLIGNHFFIAAVWLLWFTVCVGIAIALMDYYNFYGWLIGILIFCRFCMGGGQYIENDMVQNLVIETCVSLLIHLTLGSSFLMVMAFTLVQVYLQPKRLWGIFPIQAISEWLLLYAAYSFKKNIIVPVLLAIVGLVRLGFIVYKLTVVQLSLGEVLLNEVGAFSIFMSALLLWLGHTRLVVWFNIAILWLLIMLHPYSYASPHNCSGFWWWV